MANHFQRVRILGTGLLAQDRESLTVFRVAGGWIAELHCDVPKMPVQVGNRPSAFALDSDLALQGSLVGGAGGLALAEPLESHAEVVAERQRPRIVRTEFLGAAGIQPTERTGDSLRQDAGLLLLLERVQRASQRDHRVQGALVPRAVELLMHVHELPPAAPRSLQLSNFALLPGQTPHRLDGFLGLRAEAPVLRFVQPSVGATGVVVGLHPGQDTDQALESPDGVRFVGTERRGAGLGQLAESGRCPAQVAELFEIPGQVADRPERGRMLEAQNLLAAVE